MCFPFNLHIFVTVLHDLQNRVPDRTGVDRVLAGDYRGGHGGL